MKNTSPLEGRVEDAFPTTPNVSSDRASDPAGIAGSGVGQESPSTVALSAGEGFLRGSLLDFAQLMNAETQIVVDEIALGAIDQ